MVTLAVVRKIVSDVMIDLATRLTSEHMQFESEFAQQGSSLDYLLTVINSAMRCDFILSKTTAMAAYLGGSAPPQYDYIAPASDLAVLFSRRASNCEPTKVIPITRSAQDKYRAGYERFARQALHPKELENERQLTQAIVDHYEGLMYMEYEIILRRLMGEKTISPSGAALTHIAEQALQDPRLARYEELAPEFNLLAPDITAQKGVLEIMFAFIP